MEKKGASGMWGIMLYLILGLMVLTISLFFIFNEYFVGDEGVREVCWQSVQLRSVMPDSGWGPNFKEDFPLKCKTNVVEISKSDVVDVEAAERKIADAMTECWTLYGSGDLNAFPSDFFKSTTCVPCARIHLSDEAKRYLTKENAGDENIKINIADSLSLNMKQGFTYYNYLDNSGKRFSAFNFGNGIQFNLKGDNFKISNTLNPKDVTFINRLENSKYKTITFTDDVFLPKIFEEDMGDLLINYGVMSIYNEKEFGTYIPYLFYFQTGRDIDPFKEVKSKTIISTTPSTVFCEKWEGIPA